MTISWTEEAIQDLRRLWSETKADGTEMHSTAAIGRELGVSKNAIVGKAHRLDLPKRKSPINYPSGHPALDGAPSRPPSAPPLSLPPLKSTATPLLPLACDKIISWRIPAKPVERPRPAAVAIIPPPPAYGRICECVFPIGHPGKPEFRFCGEPSSPGKVYCDFHWKHTHTKDRAEREEV